MIGRIHKLKTMIVTIAIILTAFFAMATHISRDEVVASAGDDQEVDVGVPVHFDGSRSSGVGSLRYTWYFGDGETGSGSAPEHTYQANIPGPTVKGEGVYHATLVVQDSNNVYDLDTVRITVRNHYPIADAGSDRTVREDQIVYFEATESSDRNDDIVSTHWDFGDSTYQSTGLDSVVEHAYEKAGTYPVTLTITDNDGAFDKDVVFVTVENVEPIANALANGGVNDTLTIYEDEAVDFDASMSTDTSSDMPLLVYAWDFGDGSGGYGVATVHTYTRQGTYQVTLSVTDDDDASTQDTITVNVLNAAPVAIAGLDQTVDEGDTVFFDATGSSDTPSDESILDYSWSIGAEGTNPTYNWYDDSVNHVELLVKDDDDIEDGDSIDIKVENVPPVASIDGAYVLVDFTLRAAGEKWHNVQLSAAEPGRAEPILEVLRMPGSPNDQSVTEEDVHITIAENVDAVVYYTPEDDPVNGSPNGATPVWLTLTFEDGTSTKFRRTFNVQKPEEWIWVININTLVTEQLVHIEGSVYDPGTDDIQVKWDFGDGTTPITTNYVSNEAHPMQITEHVVRSFEYGEYIVSLEATDDDGGMGAMSITVTHTDMLTSTNIAPKASSTGGSTVLEDEQLTLVGVGEDTGSDQESLTYTWNFGDGMIAHDPVVTHAYVKAGVYYPTLVIADDSGDIGITSELVEVLNVIPVAVANADQVTVAEDDVISLDASSSSDTPTDLSILLYAWDFGDGSKGFGIVTTHVYSRNGLYQVTLTTTDDNGARSTDAVTIDVQNLNPYDVTITAEETVDEDRIVFFAGTTMDTPSDVPLLTYSWQFDDGSRGTGRNPTHAYTSPGTYTVRLTVRSIGLIFTR
ncbi:MAG: PKD domain-containing protein, partial [Thermoplasmata archaeon]|nr:PKD domain-containing protein [Thermoplasmata archaeon]